MWKAERIFMPFSDWRVDDISDDNLLRQIGQRKDRGYNWAIPPQATLSLADMLQEKTSQFIEILKEDETVLCDSAYVEAYVAAVEPQACGPLVKRLSKELPLSSMNLGHLKRVKRTLLDENAGSRLQENSDSDIPSSKKAKIEAQVTLHVLIGSVIFLEEKYPADAVTTIKELFHLDQIQLLNVPARDAESQDEWKIFQSIWPTCFFPNKTREFLEQELKLKDDEIDQMIQGMTAAIDDAIVDNNLPGAVLLDPQTGTVVSRSRDERRIQENGENIAVAYNPLATSILYAIQGVSRLEREAAERQGMDSAAFQKGQYLCTGYDLFTTLEPNVFEAMALTHARIRRVVTGITREEEGGLTQLFVHALPGTNHKYRAFYCAPHTELGKRCRQLHGDTPL